MVTQSVVIVGAGHGGVQTAVSLRQNGYDGRIVLVGDEPGLPYQRPPLSKSYLQGKTAADRLWLRPESFYRDNGVEFLGNERVAKIVPGSRRVLLASGTGLQYDHLILAVGARNRALPIGGRDVVGVFYLRTLADADILRASFERADNIVIIGAGFIGLEFAAVAAAQGKNVRVLEMTPRPMSRAVCEQMSLFFAQRHRALGSQFMFGSRATHIRGDRNRVVGVEITDGTCLPADMVLISVGVVPNTEIAGDAGLPVDDGIIVDEHLLTANQDISAIGDCVFFPCKHGRRSMRLESVQNAVDQARCVADRLTGKPNAYNSVPWFWSDQGELRLQIVGITAGHDKTVVRGDIESGSFSVFCYSGDELLGIESVNRPADHMLGRRCLALKRNIAPSLAADTSFDLKKCLAS